MLSAGWLPLVKEGVFRCESVFVAEFGAQTESVRIQIVSVSFVMSLMK